MKARRGDILSYLLMLGLGVSLFVFNPLQLDSTKYQTVTKDLGKLKQLNTKIDRDILHTGYFKHENHESLNTSIRDTRILKSALMQQEIDSVDGIHELLKELDNALERKTKISEELLSHFTLLNNSLLYLPTLAKEFTSGNNNELKDLVKKLSIDILNFDRQPENNNKQAINSILSKLNNYDIPDNEHKALKAIETHAKVIIKSKEVIRRHINDLFSLPIENSLNEISARYETYHDSKIERAKQLRYLLSIVVLMAAIAYTINRKRSSKLALHINNERLEHALDGANNGIWDWNIQDNKLYLSPRFEIILGYAPGTMNTRISGLKKLVHPEDLDQVNHRLLQHFKGKADIFESEHRFRKKDGTWLWVMLCGRVVAKNKKQKPIRMVGTQTDISERKQLEEKLRRDAMVFETVSEAVMICDKDNKIIAVNEAFTTITGYSKNDVIGRNPGLLNSGRHGADFYDEIWNKLKSDGTWQGEMWDRKKNGEIFACWLSVATITNSQNEVDQYISIFSDISQRKEDEELIRFQANYDTLTELPNRHLFMERLGFELQRAKREQTLIALMFIDLDRFKPINDTYGHTVGDQLLWEVSKRLSTHVRETDMVARLGGDEFTIILPHIENINEVEQMARRILKEISRPFRLNGHELFISTSIGITIYPNDATDLPTLMTNADNAMYRAKDEGRNTFCFFTHEMNQHAKEMLRLENDLHRAQQRSELVPYFQPIIDINSGKLIGAEALLRWKHPKHGTMNPNSFIPISEATGLIVPIGKWLLETVCCQAIRWRQQGPELQRICVNISGRQFRGDLLSVVENALETSGLEPECLELEIVETVLLEDNRLNGIILNQLSEMGVRLSIDDFGTGYSSLGYLKQFPFDVLKINRSFINKLPDNKDNATLVNTIISMGHGLNLEIVAEGVETKQQLEYLRSKQCHSAQGFYFSKPVPAHLFEKHLINSGCNELIDT
jgi:diguanylate cyclase (GGDEF)-like protein/PAS domain S-box-containing protein